MKKLALALMACGAMMTCGFTGCGGGGGEPVVIEAPPAEDDGQAIEGMSDEEYNAEMEKAMSEQGN